MSGLVRDVDRAIRALRERLDELDEQIGVLLLDAPGDPGVAIWPRALADELDTLHDERALTAEQLSVLVKIRPEVAA